MTGTPKDEAEYKDAKSAGYKGTFDDYLKYKRSHDRDVAEALDDMLRAAEDEPTPVGDGRVGNDRDRYQDFKKALECLDNPQTHTKGEVLWAARLFKQEALDLHDRLRSLTPAAVHEPAPSGDGRVILELVRADFDARAAAGREKYGTYLKAHNGRDALMDAYQEAVDLCMYLRQAMFERDGK
jgi:hypothetical protein